MTHRERENIPPATPLLPPATPWQWMKRLLAIVASLSILIIGYTIVLDVYQNARIHPYLAPLFISLWVVFLSIFVPTALLTDCFTI
jgi:hypothetical protein